MMLGVNIYYAYVLLFLQITYADIGFFSLFNVYLALGKPAVPNEFSGYPLVSSLYECIAKEPRIADYLNTRPDSVI